MDADLRNSLWNCIYAALPGDDLPFVGVKDWPLFRMMWADFLKLPLNSMESEIAAYYFRLTKIYDSWEWYQVYEFVEFLLSVEPKRFDKAFVEACNGVLEREHAQYRIVNRQVVEIVDATEIEAIETAIQASANEQFRAVGQHFEAALSLLADKRQPDYRNSTKESISAVEAVCRMVSGKPKASLGEALKAMKKAGAIELHPTQSAAFEKLYGYASDAEGIRHAMSDDPELDFEDAKYMLVICSAFTNYLLVKAAKADMKLEGAE